MPGAVACRHGAQTRLPRPLSFLRSLTRTPSGLCLLRTARQDGFRTLEIGGHDGGVNVIQAYLQFVDEIGQICRRQGGSTHFRDLFFQFGQG